MDIIVSIISLFMAILGLLFLLSMNFKKRKQDRNKNLSDTKDTHATLDTVQLLSETFTNPTKIICKDGLLVINSEPVNAKKLRMKPRRYDSREKFVVSKQEAKFL